MFYTHVSSSSTSIFHRYIDDEGNDCIDIDSDYRPVSYRQVYPKGLYKGLLGEEYDPVVYESIEYYNTAVFTNATATHGGMENVVYQYISDEYPEERMEFNMKHIKIFFIDIETEIGKGFPSPAKTEQEINAISVVDSEGKVYMFNKYGVNHIEEYPDTIFFSYDNEKQMMREFIKFIRKEKPHIISGWNSNGFDIPYIINRASIIFNMSQLHIAGTLSPFASLTINKEETVSPLAKIKNKKKDGKRWDKDYSYIIKGIVLLDYLDLYKKYAPKSPNYKLQTIVETELNESKVDYEPYKSLKELYENDKKLFLQYNIKDALLIHKLNNKLKFIDLTCAVAYMTKCNLEDVLHVTKVWDAYIYNSLKADNIVIPPKKKKDVKKYEGAYVKPVIAGEHKWLVSFDLTSLYPMLIDQFNISPETLVDRPPENEDDERDVITNRKKKEILDDLIHMRKADGLESALERNLTFAANGATFRKDIKGIIPKLVMKVFDIRVDYKSEAKSYSKEKERILVEMKKRGMKP